MNNFEPGSICPGKTKRKGNGDETEMKVGDRITIVNRNVPAWFGTWEIYNMTENMLHFIKIGKAGQRLSYKSAQNLLNIRMTDLPKIQSHK